MAQVSFVNTLHYQFEKVRPKIPLWFQRDDTLFGHFKKSADVEIVGGRPMRVPFRALAGGSFSQFNADGGDMGLGGGTVVDHAEITPFYFVHALQFSKQAENQTNSKEKSIESVATSEMQSALEQMQTNIEALLNTDGSGTLDTVVSVAGSVLTMNNANQFFDNQVVDVWSALGGVWRGSWQILSVDSVGKTVTGLVAPPAGTQAGDLLLVHGAPGVAAGSLFGVKYHHVDSNVGTWMIVNRASYPGKVKTPHYNAGGFALTPSMVRLIKQLMRRALGAEIPEVGQLKFHMNLDMESAWENCGLVVQSVIANQVSGDSSVDMLKKNAPKTMGGHDRITSIHATPGRIDGLLLKHWGRAVAQEIDYMDWGGQIVLPVAGASGGYSASSVMYIWTGFNVFMDGPRFGCFADSIAVPTNY